jgi:hypothetical protein
VVAWEAVDGSVVPDVLLAPIQALQATLRPATARTMRSIGRPRQGTKQMQVLAMLRRPEGVTVVQIAEAMHWQPHTVHAFLTGLGKKGISINAQRVEPVSPDKTGRKSRYSVYHAADAFAG